MGLIKMISGSVGTTFRDAVKDYFRCDGMTKDILAMPATKVMRDGTVNNASDRVITNGSVFDVAINQAALLIENGKVHDFIIATDESMTGQYRYDSTVEPSLLGGGLKDFVPTLKTMVGRFTAGGQSTNTMNLVYINLKEITENPIGIGKVAFIDKYLGTRLMLSAHGYYSFKIQNPVAFYENLVMDVNTRYDKHKILTQLKGELMPKVKRAMGMVAPLCEAGYQDIFIHDTDIANIINEEIQKEWVNEKDFNVYLTIDREQEGWNGHVGFVPAYVKEVNVPTDRTAVLCGPPIMIKFTLQALLDLGFDKTQIYTTLEFRMKCGIGKCGRCNVGNQYICKDGPVFRMDKLETLPSEY